MDLYGISDQQVEEYLQRTSGMTIARATENMRKRGFDEEYIQKELRVGVMCEEILGLIKKIAEKNPKFFFEEDEGGQD